MSIPAALKHGIGGYLLEAKAAVTARRAGDLPRPFVIFGRGRSGSTLLLNLLDQSPEISCLGEILRYRVATPISYVSHRLSRSTTPLVGFKLLSYQLRDLFTNSARQRFRDWMDEHNVRILHLRRENLLAHAISNIYAVERQAWHSTDRTAGSHIEIEISPEQLIERINGSRALFDFELEFLDGRPCTEIFYERDLATSEGRADLSQRLTERLGVFVPDSAPGLKKVTPPFESFIRNWQELSEFVADTEYSKFLPGEAG